MRCALLILLTVAACSAPRETNALREVAANYYEVYGAHEDYERFLDFYADGIVLEDMINGDRIEGKKAFAEFFNWDNPDVVSLGDRALTLEELIIDGQRVVTKGYFAPFEWQGTHIEAMQFTTILTFNDAGKIVRQVDWINYPGSLVDYGSRANSNDWIGK